MRILLRGFLPVLCLLATDAFSEQLNFRHLTIDDGLSQNAVYSNLQDSRGLMWFVTKDDLNRYDGRNFVVYQHDPFDSTTKAHSGIITTKTKEHEGISFAIKLPI